MISLIQLANTKNNSNTMSAVTKKRKTASTTLTKESTKYWWCGIDRREDSEYESQEYHLIISAKKPSEEQILQILYEAEWNEDYSEWWLPWGTGNRVFVNILDEITKEDFTVLKKYFCTLEVANYKRETFTTSKYVKRETFTKSASH